MGRIGVLGVGHLAAAMISGFVRSGMPAAGLLLSPRGLSDIVAARFGIERAPGNADLVAAASIVLLAVRPQHATEALAGLPWRRDQVLISCCAGVRLDALAAAATPATVVRAMPLTAAEFGASPTALCPANDEARAVLLGLGPVIAVASEAEFEIATVSAAIYGWAQALIAEGVRWSVAQGLPEATARHLMAATFAAAGGNVSGSPQPIADLLQALVTPGGITERGLDVLRAHGVPAAWSAACDAVLAKLGRHPAPQGSGLR